MELLDFCSNAFEPLAEKGYRFIRVQDGVDVCRWYYEHQGEGVVDIVCIPTS